MHFTLQVSKPFLRKAVLVLACGALSGAFLPKVLHATPINYNLTLVPRAGSPFGGTGTITIDAAPSSSGITDYTKANGTLDYLAFTIDNQTFTLGGANGNTLVRFLNGQLNDITFAETAGSSPLRFTLDTTSGYAFYYDDGQAASYGTMTASPINQFSDKTSPVSEPASLVLFGTGLLLSIGLLYRTKSPRFSSKVHSPEA